MKERDEFSAIINELFELVKKDGVVTLALYPLNKKMGSFPLTLMARVMIYYLDMWVQKYMDDKSFKMSSINIVCADHPTVLIAQQARHFCTELLYMDEEIEIGGFSMKGKRRLSEDLVETIDVEEVQSKVGAFVSKMPVPELGPAPKRPRKTSFVEDQKPKQVSPVKVEKHSDTDSYKQTPPSDSEEEVLEMPVRPRKGGRR